MGLFGKKDQAKEYTDIVHVVGLPIPENCKCKVMLKTQEMVISGAWTEMTLLRKYIMLIFRWILMKAYIRKAVWRKELLEQQLLEWQERCLVLHRRQKQNVR